MSKKPTVGIVVFGGGKQSLDLFTIMACLTLILGAIFLVGILLIPVLILSVPVATFAAYRLYQNRPSRLEALARAELVALREEALAQPILTQREFATQVGYNLWEDATWSAKEAVIHLALELYEREPLLGDIPLPPTVCNSIEGARYKDMIAARRSLDDTTLISAAMVVANSCNSFLMRLPPIEEGDSRFVVPLSMYNRDLPEAVAGMMVHFLSDTKTPLFATLKAKLKDNLDRAKTYPDDYKRDDIIETYLQGTILLMLPYTAVSLPVRPETKYEHTIIIGGSGQGKTVLLENLIKDDLEDPRHPSIIVVDSQQHLIAKLSRLAAVHARRLIIIDPKDAPALNVFALSENRGAKYRDAEREQMLNRSLETFSYLFDALLGSDLTAKQGAVFNYIVTLMLTFPVALGRNATLFDMVKLTEDPTQYVSAINHLDPIARDFFLKEFSGNQYRQTREQIRYRLHAILGNPTLARLFLAPTNTIDWFEEINNGSIILVDTDKNHLGEKNSSYMGRVALTLILQAVLQRGSHRGDYTPLHLYVDEAGEYFDKSIDSFLTEARKYKCGITLAIQHMGKMPSLDLRNSVAANTSTKYAGGLSAADARTLAADMHTTPQSLAAQPRLTFACYIRNVTPHAISVPVKVGVLDDAPKIQESTYHAFREANRDRLAAPKSLGQGTATPTAIREPIEIQESFEC